MMVCLDVVLNVEVGSIRDRIMQVSVRFRIDGVPNIEVVLFLRSYVKGTNA